MKDEQTKVAILVWLGFWAYFEYKTFKAVMWRSFGVEKIKIRDRKLFYRKAVRGRGKIKVYEFDFIKDFIILLQNLFPNRLNKCYILNCSILCKTLYDNFKFFIDKKNHPKIEFIMQTQIGRAHV